MAHIEEQGIALPQPIEKKIPQLDIVPEKIVPLPTGNKEIDWYRCVYQGDHTKQLTLRAIIIGSFLGGFMSLSNLYVGLKTGWGLGVAITSCILSFTIYKALMSAFPKIFKTEMTILENNCMQSTASSAGYSTGGTMVSAICAYLIITGQHMSWQILTLWTFFLAAMGVFLAIPMKRQMINIEQLKFPSGIAAAETLKSLHGKGEEAKRKAKALGYSGVFGACIAWLRDGGIPFSIPSMLPIPKITLGGFPLAKWTIGFETSAIMIAAGAIMGWKVAWSLLLGATVNYAILAPKMVTLGAISAEKLGYREIVRWSTWTGASLMVASALVAFLLQWKTIKKALGSALALFQRHKNAANVSEIDMIMKRVEVPSSWFWAGTLLSGAGLLGVLYWAFHTSIWMGLVAIVMTFFLSLVACRATGDTDTTPIGAMGKITQLAFGVLAPTNLVTNLMTASVTAGAASSAADLLTDLKSGYLLGANPRKQFIAQFLGIFAGTLVIVPVFYFIIPNASVLGTDQWPAPAAQVWAAVAKLLASGFGALHPTARWGLLMGSLIGIAIPLLERALPERGKKFCPSPMGLGLAMVIPFFNSLSMFIGALIALALEKKMPKMAGEYIIPVSSGIIAGESLMGVVVALLSSFGVLGH
jgi:OPT family oligopeptide transporter